MKWLKRKLRGWMNDDNRVLATTEKLCSSRGGYDLGSGISFTLYPASGGIVISTSSYDERVHENMNSLHIIPDDHDMANELVKIISLESLRR